MKRRHTRLRTDVQAVHTNCPKVTVHGAPGPLMTVESADPYVQTFVCPKCGARIGFGVNQGTTR